MNKTIVMTVGIIAIAAVVAFYFWSSHNRYYIMTSSKGFVYEVDRKSGQSWLLYGVNKTPHKSPTKRPDSDKPLPLGEQVKVTGNAGLRDYENISDSFSGSIYNGSTWTLTKAIINVTAKEQDGSVRWNRDFSVEVEAEPLKTTYFSVKVTGADDIKEAPWNIKQVFGYKE